MIVEKPAKRRRRSRIRPAVMRRRSRIHKWLEQVPIAVPLLVQASKQKKAKQLAPVNQHAVDTDELEQCFHPQWRNIAQSGTLVNLLTTYADERRQIDSASLEDDDMVLDDSSLLPVTFLNEHPRVGTQPTSVVSSTALQNHNDNDAPEPLRGTQYLYCHYCQTRFKSIRQYYLHNYMLDNLCTMSCCDIWFITKTELHDHLGKSSCRLHPDYSDGAAGKKVNDTAPDATVGKVRRSARNRRRRKSAARKAAALRTEAADNTPALQTEAADNVSTLQAAPAEYVTNEAEAETSFVMMTPMHELLEVHFNMLK